MIKHSHILAENMRRFGTKNLNEQDQIKFDTLDPVTGEDDAKFDSNSEKIIMGNTIGKGFDFAIRKVPGATEEDNPVYIIQYRDSSKPTDPFTTPKMYSQIYTNNGKGWPTREKAEEIFEKHLNPTYSYSSKVANMSSAEKQTETQKLEKQKQNIQKKLDQLKK